MISKDFREKGKVILVIDDSECGRTAVEKLVFLGKAGFRADVLMIFCSDAGTFPVLSQRKEMKIYTDLRIKASKFVDFYIDRLEEAGFNVTQVKIIFGSVTEEILNLEKITEPDIIIFGMEREGFIKRVLRGDAHKDVIFQTKTPVLVCKSTYSGWENKEELKCTKCALG
ncbi:universal stress protein [Archaeoglobus neptunius]|uniref:universal stress protein n=1 Tax=Archaeoglobus neptunius TaxID=2798580 RepID=UPI0019272BA2|nr:universal stress protein [Archaeoglobus neptunius]